MKIIDYLRTAIKNFSRQKMRTFLTVTAITVGSLSLILMASILIGIRQAAVDSLKNLGAFNLVTVIKDPNSISDNAQLITADNNSPSENEGKKIDDVTLSAVRNLPNVASATPTLSVWTKTIKLEGQDKKTWSNILAYDPQSQVFDMPLLAGRNLISTDMDKIVVGSRFLETFGYIGNAQGVIGKRVLLSYETGPGSGPDWGAPPAKPATNGKGEDWKKGQENQNAILSIPAEIVGVADNRMMNDDQNYVTIAWAKRLMTNVNWQFDDSARQECQKRVGSQFESAKQELASSPEKNKFNDGPDYSQCDNLAGMTLHKEDNFARSGYGSIIIKVKDEKMVSKVAESVKILGYGAVTAQNMLDQINNIVKILSLALGAIGGISLFVATIGIINTMLMAGYERVREIGVMRACGATKSTVRLLFTLEAGFLGFLGGVFGVAFSILIVQGAKFAIKKFGANLGNIPLEKIGIFSPSLIFAIVIFTTFIGILAGIYPAIRAAKLKPVEALRYE